MRWHQLSMASGRPVIGRGKAMRWLASIAALAVLAASGRAGPIQEATDTFDSGGKPIRVERFEPKEPGKHPTLVLLHGADGLTNHGGSFRYCARWAAQKGYLVLLVHYFDRTQTKLADLKIIKEHFRTWMDTISAAVAYARKQEKVDGKRVGLVGFSLGAFLALSAAAQADLRIAAVVDFGGGLPQEVRKEVKSFPPTLILHGGVDEKVPVTEAYALLKWLKSRKAQFEMKIYEDEGHTFERTAAWNACQQALAFLERHLQAKPAVASKESPKK